MQDDTLRSLAAEISARAGTARADWDAARTEWDRLNVRQATSTTRRRVERRVASAEARMDAYTDAWHLVQSYRDGGQS